MFDRRLVQNFDWTLLLILILIASVSVINLYQVGRGFPNLHEAVVLVSDRVHGSPRHDDL